MFIIYSLVLTNHPPCSVPSKFRCTPGDAETPSFIAIELGAFCCLRNYYNTPQHGIIVQISLK